MNGNSSDIATRIIHKNKNRIGYIFLESVSSDDKISNFLNKGIIESDKKKVEKTKTGKESISYKYDFNALVKEQCSKLELDIILKGIEPDNLKVMISHWREFYL